MNSASGRKTRKNEAFWTTSRRILALFLDSQIAMCIIVSVRANAVRACVPFLFLVAVMIEFLQTPQARLVVSLAILAILSVIGIYIVRRFRDSTEETETSSNMLTKFRDMRHRGVLSESDFREIRTTLADDIQAKVKRKDDSV